MPIEPGLQNLKEIRRLNQIVKIWQAQCTLPGPEIWLETFFPAFALALYEFLIPGTVEVLEMPLGRYHGLGGKITRFATKKHFPAWTDLANKLWKYTGLSIIERILFWWMVVDLIIDFLYNWESLAMEMGACKPGGFAGTGKCGGGSVYPAVPQWQPVLWDKVRDPDNLIALLTLRRPAGTVTSVGYAMQARPFFGLLGTYSVRLENVVTGHIIRESDPIPPHAKNENGAGSFWTKDLNLSTFDGAYQVSVKVTDTFVDLTDSTVTVTATDLRD